MIYKKSHENTAPTDAVVKHILEKLKRKYGSDFPDPDKALMSLSNPPGTAGHVTSLDADGDGKVDVYRINPEYVRPLVKNLTVNRIQEVENVCEQLINKAKSIDDTDESFKEDLVTIMNLYAALGALGAHEMAHSKPTLSGGEFAGEPEAEAAEKAMESRIMRDMMQRLPEEIQNSIQVRAKEKYHLILKIARISKELDRLGRSDLSDAIDDIIFG